jgi:hypothetical protein
MDGFVLVAETKRGLKMTSAITAHQRTGRRYCV